MAEERIQAIADFSVEQRAEAIIKLLELPEERVQRLAGLKDDVFKEVLRRLIGQNYESDGLRALNDRFDSLEVVLKQALGRTAPLLKSALRFTLSNNDSSYSRTQSAQTAFKEDLIERYHLKGQKGYVVCMATGIALPKAGMRAAHIVSLSKFPYAQADIALTEPWDIRNGIMWLEALEKAYEDSRIMVLWEEAIHNFRIWVLDSSLLGEKLSAGWTTAGDRRKPVQISYSSYYPGTTWGDLHGQPMHYQFVRHTHPSRHAFLWHAGLAYDLAMERGRVPADVPGLDAMLRTQVTPASHERVSNWVRDSCRAWLPTSGASDTAAASTTQGGEEESADTACTGASCEASSSQGTQTQQVTSQAAVGVPPAPTKLSRSAARRRKKRQVREKAEKAAAAGSVHTATS